MLTNGFVDSWIQRLGIILALLLIVLTFLNLLRQQKGLNMWPHYTHLPEFTLPCPPEVSEIWIPPYYRDTVVVPMFLL